MSTPKHNWLKSDHHDYFASHSSTESLVANSRSWIEECTGCVLMDKSFTEYLQDGTVLCELIQTLLPGMIRKINRIRNPFAWRENISFFLGTCSKLGVKEGLLFSPEDLIATTSSSLTNLYKSKSGRPGTEKSLRSVALTICYLALELQSRPDYGGPLILLAPGGPQLQPHEDQSEDPSSPNNFTTTSVGADSGSSVSLHSHGSSRGTAASARRVESVTNLITETSSTDIQSYAELVLCRNGSLNKEHSSRGTGDGVKSRTVRPSHSFNATSHRTSNKSSRVHRTHSDRTPLTSGPRLPPQGILQESVSDHDIPTLQQNGLAGGGVVDGRIREFRTYGDSQESFEEGLECQDFDSVTTPSEASTVIHRELLSSSRCSSNLPTTAGGEEWTQSQERDRSSANCSFENSPVCTRHTEVSGASNGEPGNLENSVNSALAELRRANHKSQEASSSSTTSEAERDNGGLKSGSTPKIERFVATYSEEKTSPKVNSVSLNSSSQSAVLGEQITAAMSGTLVVSDHQASLSSSSFGPASQDLPAEDLDVLGSAGPFVSPASLSTEQVTDIHTTSKPPSGQTRRSGDDPATTTTGPLGLRIVEDFLHSTGGQATDPAPSTSVNGVRTHEYVSSNGSKVVYSVPSAGDVPHHSLTLASSDPESPSAYQASDKLDSSGDFSSSSGGGGSGGPAQGFPSTSPRHSGVSALHVASLDMSRVQSDALPRSLLPSKVSVAPPGGGVGEVVTTDVSPTTGLKKMLADARSIDTCSLDDIDHFTPPDSPKRCPSPPQPQPEGLNITADPSPRGPVDATPPTTTSNKTKGTAATSSASHGATRPMSAPNRANQSAIAATPQFRTSGSSPSADKLKEKRKSLDIERQKRLMNIQESTRAALHYSAQRKTSKADSLPRDSRSASLTNSLLSGSSDNDVASSGNVYYSHKSSSPGPGPTTPSLSSPLHSSSLTSPLHPSLPSPLHQKTEVTSPHHESVPSNASDSTATSTSMPLNLQRLSIDQTREASLTQMDEIWRQVEAGSESQPTPTSGQAQGSDADVFTLGDVPAPSVGGNDRQRGQSSDQHKSQSSDQHRGQSSGQHGGQSSALASLGAELLDFPVEPSAKRRSDILKESDVTLSFPEPVGQSTPLRPPGLSEGGVSGGVASGGASRPELSMLELPGGEGKRNNRPASFSNKDIDSLLTTLKSLSSNEEDEDLRILEEMLKSTTFKKAKHVHDDMRLLLAGTPAPAVHRIVPSTQRMRESLFQHPQPSDEVDELRTLLRAPHVQALLFCHDKVSTHDLYVPDASYHRTAHDPVDLILSGSVDNFQQLVDEATPLFDALASRDVPFNRKENATIVYLERTNRPLGCTIYKQNESVFIGKLLKGCDAEASDMLREGDELLEVSGIPVMGRRTDDIVRLMSGDAQAGSTLAFTIIPVHDESYDIDYEPTYMRAHFNYNGALDDEIPCKALGLAFQKGEILEVVNQDEPDWWQACKVFEENAVSLPGLVPSMHLQQQRQALVQTYSYSSSSSEAKKGLKGLFSRKKKKKIYYQNTPPSNILGIGDEIPTYEQVYRVDPDPSLCRPIILIGAPGVGRRTLIRKLLNSDPSLYQPVVQHTTRQIRPGEVNGHDYHYVSREEFERDVEQDRFLEYGDFRGHLYGTAFSAIKKIMESGRVPVLDLHPQALKKIRHSGLHPYIIFVASPRLERLQVTRKVGTEKLKRRLGSSPHHADPENIHIYTESDLQHLMKESYLIEHQYGHYFDWIIVNDDFQVAADMLKEVTRRLESEPQWVPYTWKNY